MFLNDSALYLLLFRLDEPLTETCPHLRFWIGSLKARCKQLSLFLIGTQLDRIKKKSDCDQKLDRIQNIVGRMLRPKDQICGCLAISSLKQHKNTIEELESALFVEAEKMLLDVPEPVEVMLTGYYYFSFLFYIDILYFKRNCSNVED